jgi:hypothetical protein
LVINTTDRTFFGILELKMVSRFFDHLPNRLFNSSIFSLNIGNCSNNYINTDTAFSTPVIY